MLGLSTGQTRFAPLVYIGQGRILALAVLSKVNWRKDLPWLRECTDSGVEAKIGNGDFEMTAMSESVAEIETK